MPSSKVPKNSAYLALTRKILAFLNINNVEVRLITYRTNDAATGMDALIQGYVALCGLGITRIRNQIVEAIPTIQKVSFEEILSFLKNNLNFSMPEE